IHRLQSRSPSPFLFFFPYSPSPPDLHSFPTRRSSDLRESLLVIVLDEEAAFVTKELGVDQEHAVELGLVYLDLQSSGLLAAMQRSEEHTSELQSPYDLVCRLLLEKKKELPATTLTTYQ